MLECWMLDKCFQRVAYREGHYGIDLFIKYIVYVY